MENPFAKLAMENMDTLEKPADNKEAELEDLRQQLEALDDDADEERERIQAEINELESSI